MDKLRLTSEPAIAGVAPHAYTSMCCNVDFACELHRDSPKSCGHESRTVAFGQSRAGGCSWKPGRTAECAGPLTKAMHLSCVTRSGEAHTCPVASRTSSHVASAWC